MLQRVSAFRFLILFEVEQIYVEDIKYYFSSLRVKTNNTYPLILDVFTSLNKSLSECGAELHADLRGYLDHGKA